MFKKIVILSISALLLGGCTLRDVLKTGTAVKDEKPMPTTTSETMPATASDTSLEAMPSNSASTEVNSLEADINSTVILDENLSDMN